jgi:hypothetical protein
MSYRPLVNVRKSDILKIDTVNDYYYFLFFSVVVDVDILKNRKYMQLSTKKLYENIISFKDILIKRALVIGFNVKLKVR